MVTEKINYEEKGTADMNEIMGNLGRMIYFSVSISPIIIIIIANERCASVQTMMVTVKNIRHQLEEVIISTCLSSIAPHM